MDSLGRQKLVEAVISSYIEDCKKIEARVMVDEMARRVVEALGV